MLVALVSAICALRAYRNQRRRAKKGAACDLAKYYADHIINDSAKIAFLLNENNLAERVKQTFTIDRISEFTKQELDNILSQSPSSESIPEAMSSVLQDFPCADFLNTLEWFSMQCRYGIADESLLYQSLHQTFLADVQMLYTRISALNVNSEDKYYTNLIWLFNAWKKRLTSYKARNDRARDRAGKKLERAKVKASRAGNATHHGSRI